jgi:hypothetical protein
LLLKTINQIETSPSPFTLTPNEKQCLFCIYRSLCKRGTNAGNDSDGDLDEVEGALLLDLEFDQIAEFEF